MTILEVIKEPNKLLREKSKVVQIIDDELKNFMHSMLETMYHEKGMGIAAIQVGNPIRALIVDIQKNVEGPDGEIVIKRDPFFIINPEIKYLSEEKVILSEGCLSVREKDGKYLIRGDVERPKSIIINYLDLNNKLQKIVVDGNKSVYDLWFARCLQHEIDHLDGVLFIDKLYKPIEVAENEVEIVGDLQIPNEAQSHAEL